MRKASSVLVYSVIVVHSWNYLGYLSVFKWNLYNIGSANIKCNALSIRRNFEILFWNTQLERKQIIGKGWRNNRYTNVNIMHIL